MAFDIFQYTGQHRHQELHFVHDQATGLRGIIAIHSTVRGPALGGTRLWHYANTEKALIDVLCLSEGMTYKAATVALPLGGGKAVIMADGKEAHDPDLRAARLEAFAAFVERLDGRFITAEDVGTTTDDIVVMRRHTSHVVGLPDVGGDPSPITAHGVVRGMQAMTEEVLDTDSFTGIPVAIQGLGKVGMSLAKLLLDRGAVVTGVDWVSWLSSVFGEGGMSVQSAPGSLLLRAQSSRIEHSLLQKVEVSPAVHTAFEQLQPVNVAFHRSLAVGRNDSSLNRRQILAQFDDERPQLRHPTLFGLDEPRGQGLRIAIPKHLPEAI